MNIGSVGNMLGGGMSGLAGLGGGIGMASSIGQSMLGGLSGLSGIGGMLGMGDMSSLSSDISDPFSSMSGLSSMLGGDSAVSAMGSLGLGMVPGFSDLSSLMGGGMSNGVSGGMSLGIGANLEKTLAKTKQTTNMLMSLVGMMVDTTNQQFAGDLQDLLKALQEQGYDGGWGSVAPGSGSGSTGAMSGTSPSESGNAVAALAEKFLGRDSASIKGELPHFTAAGGRNNNCADFVSSLLESNGKLSGHYINVGRLEEALKNQGYHQVSADQAQPGDVWISSSRGHTEIVEKAGNPPTLIGSNNGGDDIQEITRDKGSGRSGVFYHKG